MNTYEYRTPASLKSEAAYLRQLSDLAGNAAKDIRELADLKEETEKRVQAAERASSAIAAVFSNLNDTIHNNKSLCNNILNNK